MGIKEILISLDFFPAMGGAHTWMYEVYKRWPRPVKVLAGDYGSRPCLGDEQADFDRADHGSLTVIRHPEGVGDISLLSLHCIRQFFQLVGAIRRLTKEKMTLLHCLRTFPEGIAAALYKKMFNRSCKVIVYVHGEELNVAATSRQLSLCVRWVLAGSDIVIANSKTTREKLKSFAKRLPDPVVIHPGVDWEAYQVSSRIIRRQREKWGCREGQTVLVSVSRLESRKNHGTVLAAMAALTKSGIDLKYIVAGDGEERKTLEDQAQELGLENRVLFTGVLSHADKIQTFASADIHIMPSIEAGPMVEGYGIVFVEAAAAGIPSIAGNTGGQPEAVYHGRTGLIVDGTREDQVAEAIDKLAKDKPLAIKMGAAGREWAHSQDWNLITRKTWQAVSARCDGI